MSRADMDQSDPMLSAEGCMRFIWLLVCVAIASLVAVVVLTLLWRHDAVLRAALVSIRDTWLSMYWSSLASMY